MKNQLSLALFFGFVLLYSEVAFTFGSFEHIWIGDSPVLQFPEDGLPEDQQLFTDYPYKRFVEPIAALYNVPRISPQYLRIGNLKLSVGEVVAIAGDYFTIVGSSISDADVKIPLDIKDRFLYAFSAFIGGKIATEEGLPRVLLPRTYEPNVTKLVNEEFKNHIRTFGQYVPWEWRSEFQYVDNPFKPQKSIAQLRAIFDAEFINLLETDPRLAEHLANLKKINLDELAKVKEILDKAYKSISRIPSFLEEFRDVHTMLVSKKTTWNLIKETFNWNNPPFYSQILEENLDHFGKHAIQVYTAGHELAIQTAMYAREQKSKEEQRKWLNVAYALDAFALHYLSDQFSSGHLRTPRAAIFKSSYLSKTAGLAANAMHDEDGYYGLRVKNETQRWVAYGDYSYFSERSKQNREELERCLEASFDEVFEAFLTGTPDGDFRALDLVPKIESDNFPPLFKVGTQGAVVVRDSYDNIEAKTYSAPSLLSWLRSWTYTPHWKKSSFDVRWLLNQTEPKDTRMIELWCGVEVLGEQQRQFSIPLLAVEVNLEKMGIEEARAKYFGGARVSLLLSAEKVNNAVQNCDKYISSKLTGGGFLRAFESDREGSQELKLAVTYDRNGAFVPQEFPIRW